MTLPAERSRAEGSRAPAAGRSSVPDAHVAAHDTPQFARAVLDALPMTI